MARGRLGKTTDDVLLKSAEFLGWALGGLEREIAQTRERLSSLTAQADSLRERIRAGVSGAGTAGAAEYEEEEGTGEANRAERRGRMSPEARKRISEMMKKRWAERRKAGGGRL